MKGEKGKRKKEKKRKERGKEKKGREGRKAKARTAVEERRSKDLHHAVSVEDNATTFWTGNAHCYSMKNGVPCPTQARLMH